MHNFRFILYIFLVLSATACDKQTPTTEPGTEKPATQVQTKTSEVKSASLAPKKEKENVLANYPGVNYETLEWTELMPEKDLEALLNPPEYLNEIEDGSIEDQIANQIQAQLEVDENDPYQKALVSTDVRPEMDGKLIRLPGFVVPLEFGESETQITKFFLVPFFGACIHVPPPPPNQIVYVEHSEGIQLKSLQDAFWLSGKLSTSLTENETAVSAYSLELHQIVPYYN